MFNRWDFRLDRRVLRTIRDKATVRAEPLDLGGDDWRPAVSSRPAVDVATARNPVLQCLRTEDARWMTA